MLVTPAAQAAASHRGPGDAAEERPVLGVRFDGVVGSRVVDVAAVEGDELVAGWVDLDGGGSDVVGERARVALVVVVGRGVGGVVPARVVWVAVVGDVRGTVSCGDTDAGRTRT